MCTCQALLQYPGNQLTYIVQFYILYIFFLTVPGLSASQLSVNDSNHSSVCYTNKEYYGLWINISRLLHRECASHELK